MSCLHFYVEIVDLVFIFSFGHFEFPYFENLVLIQKIVVKLLNFAIANPLYNNIICLSKF